MIHSVAGTLKNGGLIRSRPFRDPHHSASVAALVGGGLRARPGEVSLAHRDVLFLDELPEYTRVALEALRQPLESGRATIARANGHVTYPAEVQLVAAMNPCRCGHLDDPRLACGRAPRCAVDYQSRISGPLFDRIDLYVDVVALSPGELALPQHGERSETVALRVAAARAGQAERYRSGNGVAAATTNARINGEWLDAVARPDAPGRALLREATDRLALTARGYHRVLKVARTLADLDGCDAVRRVHIAEALSYRRLVPGRNTRASAGP